MNLRGSFNVKVEQLYNYLIHNSGDEWVQSFPKSISPKVNVMPRLEFEPAYYVVNAQRVIHDTLGASHTDLNWSIWTIHGILIGTITPDLSKPVNNGYEWVLQPQSSMTGASPPNAVAYSEDSFLLVGVLQDCRGCTRLMDTFCARYVVVVVVALDFMTLWRK